MKPNTRLLIRFDFIDGSMKSWGYDSEYYKTKEDISQAIVDDFTADFPDNVGITLFYYTHNSPVVAETAEDLATATVAWLQATGDYH